MIPDGGRPAGAEPPPGEPLATYRPGIDGPWGPAEAGHLVRRAALGMPEPLVRMAVERGPAAAAEELFRERPEDPDALYVAEAAERLGTLEGAQAAWAYRLVGGAHPARERWPQAGLTFIEQSAKRAIDIRDPKIRIE